MKIKYIAIFLVLLSCIMGAASAADDVSIDAVDASVDDAVAVDAVSEDIGDSVTDDPILSEDTTNEEINEATIEKENKDVEQTRGTPTTANNWTELKSRCENTTDMEITLTGTNYDAISQIYFLNNATIIGSESSYITGNYNGVPFLNENPDLTITFRNVKFKNMNVENLLELSGTNILENCSFYKVSAYTGHNSVVYNTYGTMSLIGCNMTNCSAGYGVVSNYNPDSVTDVVMYVDDCKFINNSATVEPGVINNCGILYVNNSEFINNSAGWWAGAIHTHSNAQTYINNTNFTGNIAGWNGGALYTYSKLVVCNSIFKENKCRTSAGGGAIGCSNWGSSYNITIFNCTFEENENLCGHTNETPSTGTGGAISAMNNGILKVCNSTFVHNVAKTGQAIAAYSQGYISPEGNITEGIPKVIVCNNTFINHTLTTSDTVKLTGNYTFSYNTFTNCYQTNLGINNTFNSPVTSNNLIFSEELIDTSNKIKLSSKNILGDDSSIEERYVTNIDELKTAYDEISDNGIIYLSDGSYNWLPRCANSNKNVTFIGQSKNTIFTLLKTVVTSYNNPSPVLTFINLTFNSCVTYNLTFDNCEFKDFSIEKSIFTIYKYGKVVLNNCTFDNIVADSIIGRSGDFIDQDGIYLYDCKFTNCNIKGVADIPGNIEILDFCAIENCDYDFDATTDIAMVDDYAHNYLNATKLKVVAVDSAVDISSSEKGVVVITLTDGANPIAGATVKYTVNGAEEHAVNYEGNESFNAISDSKFFNFTEEPVVPPKVATKITAPKVTATYNVAKNLVITLTDKDGKVLANKKVTVKVGTISKTLTTNAKGQVSLNVATLAPKTYTATVKFAGDDGYLASSLSPKVVVSKAKVKLAAKAKTFKVKVKTKKYTVTLKNNKGKVMKKVKLTLKVGKKTYKATTNSKGKATFKITKLTKKGKYTATIKFAGSKYYKALSKKVKITVKK